MERIFDYLILYQIYRYFHLDISSKKWTRLIIC